MKHIRDKQLRTCIQADYGWKNVSFYLVMLGDVIVAIGENSIAKMETIMDAGCSPRRECSPRRDADC